MKNVKLVALIFTFATLFFTACNDDKSLGLDEQLNINETTANTEVDIANGETRRRCGMHDHMAKLLESPEYKKAHEQKLLLVSSMVGDRAACSGTILLPVAVHFQGVSNPDVPCLSTLAQTQIDILNQDYTGTNSDISLWNNNASPSFPGVNNGEMCVEFKLADQNHPTGFGLNNGDPAVTVNQTNGDSDANWSGYLNIFVQFNTGVLGYSPLGGSGNGDGVVIDAAAFGSGNGCGNIAPQSPYDLGRTLTHELGHYLLLDHIWGNGCSQDDDVADTPDSNAPYYDCPNIGASTCSSTDMHMNYMDYTNDACMYMFSDGQATLMNNYLTSSLNNVINNAPNVISSGGGGGGGNDPTCDDGIQNGDETGVDCGGSCEPCIDEPTCDDGIQNGDETGVDCGGSCEPCNVPTECTFPQDPSVTILNGTSVQVNWTAIPTALKYRIKYREAGIGADWIKKTVTNASVTLNNLFAGVTYEYRLRTRCGDGTWTPFGPKETFIIEEGGSNGSCELNSVTFELTLDDFGSETTWELEDDFGNIIAVGGPYEDGQSGSIEIEDLCLDTGCYTFYIYDAWGDGICCDYGFGSYVIYEEDGFVLVESDGYFGSYEISSFCVGTENSTKGEVKRDQRKANIAKKAKK
jgi:hypothetical protein